MANNITTMKTGKIWKAMMLALLVMCYGSIKAKTTYIPTYTGVIQIVADGDTILTSGITPFVGLISQDNTIAISINHEVVDDDKVKAIKRAKRAAGWAGFAAVMSGVSVGLNPGRTPRDAMMYSHQLRMMDYSVDLANYTSMNAKAEKVLSINYRIENISDKEIQVADMQSGLTWYIMPHEYLELKADNPDGSKLRIANTDPFHQDVKYAILEAGSYVTKEIIAAENDDYWLISHMPEEQGAGWHPEYYVKTDKTTFVRDTLSADDGKIIIKQLKKKD